ncbi:hypothetical protein NK213_20265, partial [Sebaldella sp. S0638]|nr:hypothetical protein [Sebaldella sp. S0638]
EIERYRTELNTVTRQINNMGNTSGGATSGVQKLMASLGGVKGILAGLGIAVGIRELGKLGLQCINSASDIKELDNVLEQVFGKGKEDIAKWAEGVSTDVGRASYQLQKFASVYGSIFKGSGIKTEDFQDMSTALSQLTADFSSFFNVADDEAFTALKAGLTGESEPLKRFGIILNETTAAEYALSQGIKTKWKEMSEAQKQLVRYNFLMDKTNFIQGDAERTIGSYANQLKVMEAYIDNISRAFGQKFIPAGEGVLGVINNMLGAVDRMVDTKNIDDYAMQFYSIKTELEGLYARYSQLSQIEGRSPEQEKERLAIYQDIAEIAPEIVGVISNEASEY